MSWLARAAALRTEQSEHGEAFRDGAQAAERDPWSPDYANPHRERTDLWVAWNLGWNSVTRKIANE